MKGDPDFLGKGTHNYRAPEIIDGNCFDPFAADIYSVGSFSLFLLLVASLISKTRNLTMLICLSSLEMNALCIGLHWLN